MWHIQNCVCCKDCIKTGILRGLGVLLRDVNIYKGMGELLLAGKQKKQKEQTL